MKNLFKIISFTLLAVFTFTACTEDLENVYLKPLTQPTLLAALSSNNYVVNDGNLDKTFETFVFKKPNYGTPVEIKSQIQIALADTNFENPVFVGAETNEDFIKLTYAQINSGLIALGLPSDVPAEIELRVRSYVKTQTSTTQISETFSNPVKFNITPFIAGPAYPFTDLYLIGASVADSGWNNSVDNMELYPLQKDLTNPNIYTFSGYIKNSGGFKVIKDKGSWATNWGSDGSSTTNVKADGSNFNVASDGYYKFTIDVLNLTYSIVPIDPPSNNNVNISIIGTVNGNWDTDTDLVRSTYQPHIWYKTVDLNAGEFKFRANHDWSVNWGFKQEFFGTGVQNGDNIPLATTWKYNVYFNDITGDYTLLPVF